MKKIVCELCEGTEFSKENGMFVCQGCGTKYSAEEARSMMQEVDGDAPAAGTPVGTSAGNPNQQQIDNLLVLATNAYETKSYEETEVHCNRIIEIDSTCYNAWFLKGCAVGWNSNLINNRIKDSAFIFLKAIDFAPEEEKQNIIDKAYEELEKLGFAVIDLRQERFVKRYDDNKEVEGFKKDVNLIFESIDLLSNAGYVSEKINGYPEECAKQIETAANFAAMNNENIWKGLTHPSNDELRYYMRSCDNVYDILLLATKTCDRSNDEFKSKKANIERYKHMALIKLCPVGKCSYRQEYYPSRGRVWEVAMNLTDENIKHRKKLSADCQNLANAAELYVSLIEEDMAEAEEEEKKKRIENYWNAHADEKAALDKEKKQLSEEKASLDNKIKELNDKIKTCKKEENIKVPSESEVDNLKEQIKELSNRRAGLGLFAGKEKKQITEEIAALDGRIDSLKGKVEEEKKVKAAEVQKKIMPIQDEKKKLESERTKVTNRISEIDEELTRDPEA